MFHSDPRREAVLSHFSTKRQRSNAAKTIFATMTQEELKVGSLLFFFQQLYCLITECKVVCQSLIKLFIDSFLVIMLEKFLQSLKNILCQVIIDCTTKC